MVEWLAKGEVKIELEPAAGFPPGLLEDSLFGTPDQRVFFARARAFVQFSATQPTSLIALPRRFTARWAR